MQRYLAWAAVIIAVLGLATQFILARWPQAGRDVFAQCRSSKIAALDDQIGQGQFTLRDGNDKMWTRDELFEKPALVYFGYTFCPDVCPFDTVRNADAVDILKEQGVSVTPIFITIDPQRDTPEVLQDFAQNIYPDMIALGGSEEELAAARKTFYAVASIPPDQDPEYYVVDHTTLTYFVLPQNGFVEFFRRDTSAEDMANKITCFLEAGSQTSL